jgi:aspartate racemase
LVEALNLLRDAGASEIVICCVTIHYLLPRLEADLRRLITSMLDVIFSDVKQSNQRHLLICSAGTRKLKLFESHDDWEVSSKAFVLPDLADQERIHRDLIYPIKRNANIRDLFRLLETFLEKYGVSSFVVGCSEIHLLAKRFLADGRYRDRYDCIDPFTSVVRRIMRDRR